jgi:hypothetical protein
MQQDEQKAKAQHKRLYCFMFGHFETNPDKTTPGTYTVGSETYEMPDPQLLWMSREELKTALIKAIDGYIDMIDNDKE